MFADKGKTTATLQVKHKLTKIQEILINEDFLNINSVRSNYNYLLLWAVSVIIKKGLW